jgi:hypothetical protein
VLRAEEFQIRTPGGTLVLWVDRRPVSDDSSTGLRLSPHSVKPAPEAAGEARFFLESGFERGDPKCTWIVRSLLRDLGLAEIDLLAEPFASPGRRDQVPSLIQRAFESGRIRVARPERPRLAAPLPPPPPLPPLPRPPPSAETFYELRFVDETGQPVGGFPVEFQLQDEVRQVPANAGGVALIERTPRTSANASTPDPGSNERQQEPRWQRPRPGNAAPE